MSEPGAFAGKSTYAPQRLDRIDIDELNHALRRQLRSHGRDYARPSELVNEHLANQHRPANA